MAVGAVTFFTTFAIVFLLMARYGTLPPLMGDDARKP